VFELTEFIACGAGAFREQEYVLAFAEQPGGVAQCPFAATTQDRKVAEHQRLVPGLQRELFPAADEPAILSGAKIDLATNGFRQRGMGDEGIEMALVVGNDTAGPSSPLRWSAPMIWISSQAASTQRV